MSKETQSEQPKLRNIVVSIVITPEGETLRTDASVSVNGKQAESVQVGLILAGDLSLGVTSGTESLQSMRAVAQGATALAEGLREQVFSALEGGLAQLLKPNEGQDVYNTNTSETLA